MKSRRTSRLALATCVGRLRGTLPWQVTRAEGRYQGVTGNGTGWFRAHALLGRNPDGTCTESQEYELAHLFIARYVGTATA